MQREEDRSLQGQWVDMLRDGDASDYGGDRSRAAMALAVAFVNAGKTYNDWHEEMTDPRNGAATWYRLDHHGRPRRDWQRRIRRDWDKAVAFVRESSPIRSRAEVQQIIGLHRQRAASMPWPGRSGPTDRAVLTALLVLATRCSKIELAASVRDLAVLSGAGRATVSRSLKRLTKAKWLTQVRAADLGYGTAAVYRLTPRPHVIDTTDSPLVPLRSDPGSDLWRGLGKTTLNLHDALSEVPFTVPEIAQATGRRIRTVNRHLKVLSEEGLAQEVWPGAWVRHETDETAIVQTHDWSGRRERHAQAQQRERQAHTAQQDAYRQKSQFGQLPSNGVQHPRFELKRSARGKELDRQPRSSAETSRSPHPIREAPGEQPQLRTHNHEESENTPK